MILAYWTILIAAVLPYILTGIAKGGGGYDNRSPRAWQEGLQSWRQRADWAHRNAFEAFPAYAAAVLVAGQSHAPSGLIGTLAGVFILARIAHGAAYIADQASVRSLCWFVAFACMLAILSIGILNMG